MVVKNKNIYNLSEITVRLSWLLDGCGKKVEKPRVLTIAYGNKLCLSAAVENFEHALKVYNEWLEKEYDK